ASESYQTFASYLFSKPGLARAQYHEIGGQLEVVDFMRAQEPVLRRALLIHKRKHQTRQLGISAVQKPVRRKVNETVLTEFIARCGGLARREVGRFLSIRFGREREYLFGFLSCAGQSWNREPAACDAGFAGGLLQLD